MGRKRKGLELDGEFKEPEERAPVQTSYVTKGGRRAHDFFWGLLGLEPTPPAVVDAMQVDQDDAGVEQHPMESDNYPPPEYNIYDHDFNKIIPEKRSAAPGTNHEQKTIVQEWAKDKEMYLHEIMAREGLVGQACQKCNAVIGAPLKFQPVPPPIDKVLTVHMHRCLDCHASPTVCEECAVRLHEAAPLHRIQCWNGDFWERTTLADLGLVVHLGHGGNKCPYSVRAGNTISAFHVNGFHPVNVTYCSCGMLGLHHKRRFQLLHHGWFPASQEDPRTIFTLDALNLYDQLQSQGRASGQDFYDAMVLFTDGSGLSKIPKRYDEFLAIFRCYSHLQMLKHAGRAHDPSGPAGTTLGGLAVDCTMCPQVGKNLREDYMGTTPENVSYKNTLFIAEDACMKVKGKDPNNRGKDRQGLDDKSLCSGGSYFVAEDAYAKEIQDPVHATKASESSSTCDSTHRAFNQAETKFNRGYSVTGVGGIVCSRHGLVRPKAVGDLQKGERYVNMDYIFLSTLASTMLCLVVASYDIACQWGIHFAARNSTFPPAIQRNLALMLIRLAIPKLHIMVHGMKCQGPFSLNWMLGVGRTDGESVERFWAATGPATGRTSEMTPGNRKDHLNNLWGSMNWRKVCGAGAALLKKVLSAQQNRDFQRSSFERFQSNFPPEEIATYEGNLAEWYKDTKNQPCPFYNPVKKTVFTERRDELIKEEDERVRLIDAAADAQVTSRTMNVAEFASLGIELEEAIVKHKLAENDAIKTTGATTAELRKKRKNLHTRIAKWQAMQPLFMPQLSLFLLTESAEVDGRQRRGQDDQSSEQASDPLTVRLPSTIPLHARVSICSAELLKMELELRLAQADSSLDTARMWLRHKKQGFEFKRKNISGQRASTRAYSQAEKVQKHISKAARTYRIARQALVELGVPVNDDKSEYCRFRILRDADLQSPGLDKEPTKNLRDAREMMGEGTVVRSWIWDNMRGKDGGVGETGVVGADLRVEWFRSKARVTRWEEELVIVEEEMRRVLAYHAWKANDWREKGQLVATASDQLAFSPLVLSGMLAYAERQADMWERMARSFIRKWGDVKLEHTPSSEWCTFPVNIRVQSPPT